MCVLKFMMNNINFTAAHLGRIPHTISSVCFHSLSLTMQSLTPCYVSPGPGNTKRIDKDEGSRRLDAPHWCLKQVFPAMAVKRKVWNVKVHLHRRTALQGTKRLRYETYCTCYTEAGIWLWSNISIPWCPWPRSHNLLLMQAALLASLLYIISKPQSRRISIM